MAEKIEAALSRLALAPPQCLLLEGGDEGQRLDAALYWAKTVNCAQARQAAANGEPARPCGTCQVCRQIAANEFIDLGIYDGRISNRQDEESPGPIRALSMENMHALRSAHATAPRGDGRRVAIFQGMSQTREEALNSLLKTLEEPSPHSLFVLLAPQRQQLLPTLVSRSFCLTLPWTGSSAVKPELADWEKALGIFLLRGAGFLDKIAGKGAVDASLAAQIAMCCQRSLCRVLSGAARQGCELDQALTPLARNLPAAMLAQRWAAEALDMLAATVAPARVLEGFCSRLYILLRRKQ